ncbi:MAG: glycosyltransferase family 2 protein [bacterium]|nr:glycosyltransferase family 2 protein [bacterium]
MKLVDILVAVRNEEKSIPEFISKMKEHKPENVKINIIFLEDGSTDGTVALLRKLSENDENVNYISFENKFGQYAALTYGLTISKADAVITMDVDGGHPVEIAMKMIRSYFEGNKLVQGHRIVYKRRKFYRTIMSYSYNLFYFLIVGANFFKQNVMFRLIDRSTKEKFLLHKNWWHIFRTNFRKNEGIKTSYIQYEAPERELGESKYGFFRLLKLSYKSFFALLSFKRLMVINLILICLVYLFASYVSIVFSIFIALLFLIVNISFYLIMNNYPLTKLKIIETSLPELKQ